MKEEIEEILDYFKRSNKNKLGFEQDKIITYKEANQLLDYITNLQEENKIQKEKIEHLLIDLRGKSEYKQRNEKAIEKLESIRIFGLRSGKTLLSTLINETIDILKGDEDE